jgi:hypothetical protein
MFRDARVVALTALRRKAGIYTALCCSHDDAVATTTP